jgi:hypothetical protein
MRVYKFLTAEFGMKSLREKRLKISIFDDLNDPFDLLPYEVKKGFQSLNRLSDNRARNGHAGKRSLLTECE